MQQESQLATVPELPLEDSTKRRKGKEQKQSLPRSPGVIDNRRNSTLRGTRRGGCFVLWGTPLDGKHTTLCGVLRANFEEESIRGKPFDLHLSLSSTWTSTFTPQRNTFWNPIVRK
ncbi:hypothetical protein CEXT_438471 [Caerostris extrusa]|uniref:Uncharacterized protein n=1 Tax=Caerostris extrusa TaxID=172846 RepID=A0AAV4PNB7_CAEEX|nr:hypothetical protein CEXT_438471 [Caerostris extrusa]